MEALILLMIGVIVIPILLIIVHFSKKKPSQPQEEAEHGIKITVGRSTEPVLTCPRCGSPVMLRSGGWECGWCLDSGGLDSLPRTTKSKVLPARFICSVELPETWAELKAELCKLVPEHADALLSSLGRVAVHQLSISSPPEDGNVESQHIRDLYAFLASEKDLGVGETIAARIEQGEELFADEGTLSAERFGAFWQVLLDALEDEGIIPWEADTEPFFRSLACFRSWRGGGPGADHAFLENKDALMRAFYERWEKHYSDDNQNSEEPHITLLQNENGSNYSFSEESLYSPFGIPEIKEAFNCPSVVSFDERNCTIDQKKLIKELDRKLKEREKQKLSFGSPEIGAVCYYSDEGVSIEGIQWYKNKQHDSPETGSFVLNFSNGEKLCIENVCSFVPIWKTDGGIWPGGGSRYKRLFAYEDLYNVIFYIYQLKYKVNADDYDARRVCKLLIYRGPTMIDSIDNIYGGSSSSIAFSRENGRFAYTPAKQSAKSKYEHWLYNCGEKTLLGADENAGVEVSIGRNYDELLRKMDSKRRIQYIDDTFVHLYFFDNKSKASSVLLAYCKMNADAVEQLPPALFDDPTQNYHIEFRKEKVEEIKFAFYCISRSGGAFSSGINGYGIFNVSLEYYQQVLMNQDNLLRSSFWRLSDEEYCSLKEILKELYEQNHETYSDFSFPESNPYLQITPYSQNKFFVDYVGMQVINAEYKAEYEKIYQQLLSDGIVNPQWKSEYFMYELVSKIFPDAIYQYHASWLGRQSLDVYVPSQKIGFEYQGAQHYKPVEIWGGDESLKIQTALDKKKKNLCKANGVSLIEIRYDEPLNIGSIKKKINKFVKI